MDQAIKQHHRMAMGESVTGQKLKKGGVIKSPKIPMNPVTAMKKNNGIPGMKSGGKVDSRLKQKTTKKAPMFGGK